MLVLLRGCVADLRAEKQAASHELAGALLASVPLGPGSTRTPACGQGYRQCLGRVAAALWDGGHRQGYP